MESETQAAVPEELASFVGPNKVVSVIPVEGVTTSMGSPLVDVTYLSGKTERLTKKTYELVVTDIPSDFTIVQRTKFNQMTPAVIAILSEYDIRVFEIPAFLQNVAGSIDNSFARATNWLWTKDDDQYIPGGNPMHPRTLLEADAVIKSIPDVVEAAPVQENGKPA